MSRLLAGYLKAQRMDGGLLVFALLSAVLPVLCLAGFGLFAVFQQGYWVELLGVLLITSLAISVPYLVYRRRSTARVAVAEELPEEAESLVQPSPEWSDFDRSVWQAVSPFVIDSVQVETEWSALKPLAWEIAEQVARHYYPASREPLLEFSAPEFLLMLEELSRRYRRLLNTHVPYVEKVSITRIRQGYRHRDKLQLAKKFYDVYRLARLSTPEGILAEMRGRVTGHLFDQLSTSMQLSLKRAAIQEAASVAIDLYSKRFRVAASELGVSQGMIHDEALQAVAIEPLRIAFVGQVSSGKSSLINALMGTMAAEVSPLPSTSQTAIHQCRLEGVDLLHLVDLPGLDGNAAVEARILEQLTRSDLVIWVLQANRPARSLDQTLKSKFEAWYQKPANRSRKKPVVVAAINQVDRLQPVAEWSPPYDLEAPDSPKAKVIRDAVAYNEELLQPDHALALSVAEGKPAFNVERLESIITEAWEQGVQTQLNRRRHEAGSLFSSEQVTRLLQLGKAMWQQVDLTGQGKSKG